MMASPKTSQLRRAKIFTRLELLCAVLLVVAGCAFGVEGAREPSSAREASSSFGVGAQVAQKAGREPTQNKSVVFGRAVYEDTGRAVRRARIVLFSPEKESPNGGAIREVVTNLRGEFRMKEIPPGRYYIAVDASGILSPASFLNFSSMAELREARPDVGEMKKHFQEVVLDGANEVEIEVRARRGASITGRVTFADGDPAINVPVQIMRGGDARRARFFTSLNPTAVFGGLHTDDRGVYRVSGLPPGEYIIGVSEMVAHAERTEAGPAWDMSIFGSPLATTYYPSTADAKKATPVRVEAGQEVSGIDVTLAERPMFKLAGVVRSRLDNRPLARAHVRLYTKEEASEANLHVYRGYGDDSRYVSTDAQGRFEFNELPDGVYQLSVAPNNEYYEGETTTTTADTGTNMNANMNTNMSVVTSERRPPRKKFVPKMQEVTINGTDMANVVVQLSEGGRISGTVTIDGGKPIPDYGIHVMTERVGEKDFGSPSASVRSNGKFVVEGLAAGATFLHAFGNYKNETYYVKSIKLGSRDLEREPLEVGEGSEITGVQIVISSEPAKLAGRVTTGADKRGVGMSPLLLAPTDPARRQRQTAQCGGVSDSEGRFEIACAPGEYVLIVFGQNERPHPLNEEEINARLQRAQRVTLRAGETKQLEISAPEVK